MEEMVGLVVVVRAFAGAHAFHRHCARYRGRAGGDGFVVVVYGVMGVGWAVTVPVGLVLVMVGLVVFALVVAPAFGVQGATTVSLSSSYPLTR
jgi:hypothetical protein